MKPYWRLSKEEKIKKQKILLPFYIVCLGFFYYRLEFWMAFAITIVTGIIVFLELRFGK